MAENDILLAMELDEADVLAEFDPPLDVPQTGEIAGTVRDAVGQVYLGGATVILIRADYDVAVAETTSSVVDGTYSFPRNVTDATEYYAVAFAAEGGPDPIQAITERTLTAEAL